MVWRSQYPFEGMLPAIRGEFRVDVRKHANEILVVADLPGIEKENINVNLINPRTLEIKCEHDKETDNDDKGYFVREREYRSLSQLVVLPHDVSDDGASATFKNGVLELKLKIMNPEKRGKIPIE